MFKKFLVTIAALGAFAGSAFAGVTLYGAVDGGFQYSYTKIKGKDAQSAFKLADGIGTSNQFGIKGEEKISDDLTVGFKLENGFSLANGKLGGAPKKVGDSTVLFDREAVMYVKTVAGTIAVGREGAISSGFGMFGQFGGKVAAYGNGRGDVPGMKWVLGDTTNRYDQSLTYESPKFAGVKVLAQFANKGKQDGDGFLDSKKNDLFYALGATFENEQFYGTALVDVTTHAKVQTGDKPKDGIKVSIGGNVKIDGVQIFAAGQYFKDVGLNVSPIAEQILYPKPLGITTKGFGLNAGVAVRVSTGSLKGNLGFMKAKQTNPKANLEPRKFNRFILGVVYDYPLSKTTFLYSGLGATFDKYKNIPRVSKTSSRAFAANFGFSHKF